MDKFQQYTTLKLPWDQVAVYIGELISALLGRKVCCQAATEDNDYWNINIIKGMLSSDEIVILVNHMGGEFTQQDICGLWPLSKQTVNTIITHMAQKGYVTLEVIPGTRNRKRIILTEEGRTYGEKIVMPVSMGEQRTLERLPREELAMCTNTLGKYISILKEEINGTEEL